MGRRPKLRPDPALAQAHAAGSKVQLVHPSLHVEYGPMWIGWPVFWVAHLHSADQRYARLRELDWRVLALEVESSGARVIRDDELVNAVYECGVELVIHTVLGLHHLTVEMERATQTQAGALDDLAERLKSVLKVTGYAQNLGSDLRYSQLSEIVRTRNAIEHPTASNTYAKDDALWDAVPLAWFASGKALRAYEQTRALITEIIQHWATAQAKYARGRTLQIDQRGVRAMDPARKPPRR